VISNSVYGHCSTRLRLILVEEPYFSFQELFTEIVETPSTDWVSSQEVIEFTIFTEVG
jgi:hypothetical protein